MGNVYTNPPQSRNEAILRATIDGTEYEAPPQSRMEDLLVELKAAIEQGGGIGSYNDLNNKPKINSVTLQGDQSISDLFDGKVDIGVGTVEESGYVELKDENGDRIFRASSANGGASVESGALIGQPGALVLYNGEGGVSSVSPKGGVSLVDVDLPAENGTLALDSQIASSQTPAKAAVVTVPDASPINAEDITVDITPQQDLHGYDKPWAGGAGKNKLPMTVAGIKALNTAGTWSENVYTYRNVSYSILTDNDNNITGLGISGTNTERSDLFLPPPLLSGLSNIAFSARFISGSPVRALKFQMYGGTGTERERYINADPTESKWSVDGEYTVAVLSTYQGSGDIAITLQIEEGSTATAFAPYSNICPIEGWTGAELTQKDVATNPTVTRTYSTDFGETVYGGKWHVTKGGTDKTHGNIANYNGETINEPWLSSMDKYVAGATPTTGAQVVYPLTTPTTISTPKQNVPMLQGINTVSADCGDTQLKYQPDNVIGELKGMIQVLDARVTALEEAE